MMETDELPALDPNVDFRQVPPIHQKRTIAFINHFIMRTVSFLNTFATSCESRLMDLEYKLEKVEASLLILESQLSSIPWLDDKTDTSNESQITVVESSDINNIDLPEVEIEKVEEKVVESELKSGPKASEDPRFMRFFKMVQFGVPIPAVKLKMETEGLDSTILDNPDMIVPGCDNTLTEKTNSDSSSS